MDAERKVVLKPAKKSGREETVELAELIEIDDERTRIPSFGRLRKVSNVGELLGAIGRIDTQTLEKGIERILKRTSRIRPCFSYSWLSPMDDDAKKHIEYSVEDAKIVVYSIKESNEFYYHIMPFEYSLPSDYIRLIYDTKEKLAEYAPKNISIESPEQVRNYVSKSATKLIYQLSKRYGIPLGKDRTTELETVKKLAEISARYTAGLGITEYFLKDAKIQDVYVDAPSFENRIYITFLDIAKKLSGRFETNVSMGTEDAEGLLSRFRYRSGRPFSEAMPVLETDISNLNARITVIGKPLSPEGIAIAMRRHSTAPWTLLKLIELGTLNALSAGLISFLVDGNSTILVAGARGAGKTSLLSAILLELQTNRRIITIEDTLELPVSKMQSLGYKVQSIYVHSPIFATGKGTLSAEEALKVSLRLGESILAIGEIRGSEAKTLYEAMRTGAAGSSVLCTVHADSAKTVYERAIYDMGIPPKSFFATDIVIVVGLMRPFGCDFYKRKVIEIAELQKYDAEECNFQNLIYYDVSKDSFIETDIFKYRSERIGKIAASWGISLEEAIQEIYTRASYREKIVEYAREKNKFQLLEADWVVKCNNAFRNFTAKYPNNHSKALEEWETWFERNAKYA